MMRSLFAGVSGLQNHQVKMDVIGNNIANINTIGFKAGQVNFEESLTQLLKDASRPRSSVGGINPRQIGLGSAISSISTNFNQGNLQTTNVATDMAIQGNAFFVLSDGTKSNYTRAGNFVVDGEGKLVSPKNGFIVQGMMADNNGIVHSSAPIDNILLPFGQKSPAHATEIIEYYCNLNSDTNSLKQIWSGDIAKAAEVTGTAAPGTLTINAAAGNNVLNLVIDDDMGGTVTRSLDLDNETAYASISDLVAEINRQIASYEDINGEVLAKVEDNGGVDVVKIYTLDKGGTSSELTLSGNACPNLNLSTTKVAGTSTATDMNDLSIVSTDLTTGDKIRISGVNPDGTVVSSTYTYTAGDTVQEFLDGINSAFSGSTATLSNSGHIQLTDAIAGKTSTVATMTFIDDDSSGSAISLPTFISVQDGRNPGTHTASITVFDSKGAEHTVGLNFTNISTKDQPDIWAWEAVIDNGEIIPTTGNTGNVRFNSNGSLAVFTVDSGQALAFDPGNGAEAMSINLDGGDAGTFNGITQLDSPTTTVAKHQDGYGMGNLQTISIDEFGEITGHFSNGISQTLAQLVLATFNNPAGLIRSGDSMYSQSSNSGTPVKGRIGSGIEGVLSSGALEMSNVDLAQEFTEMIIAQRGFQANARVITTSDTLLDEIVRLKR